MPTATPPSTQNLRPGETNPPRATSPSQVPHQHSQPQTQELEQALNQAKSQQLIEKFNKIQPLGQNTDSTQPNQPENPHRHTVRGIFNVLVILVLILIVALFTYYFAPDL